MCKIFAMSNALKIDITPQLLAIIRDAVCKYGDKDGFGYAASTAQGSLWGERTVNPMQFAPLEQGKTAQLPIVPTTRNAFGKPRSGGNRALIAHGRMSTNDISLDNTHPFVSQDAALIHNGVVYDPGKQAGTLKTTCDSEILLNLWSRGGFDAIEDHAAGYYAIAVLDREGQLHVARDDRAQLHIAFAPALDSFLIATTPEIIADIAKRMGWTIEGIEPVCENTYAVFRGSELIRHREIVPVGSLGLVDSRSADKALGRYLDADYESTQDYLDAEAELNADDSPDVVEYIRTAKGRY